MGVTSFLNSLYTALAVFGVGVLIVDLMGLLGGGQEDSGTEGTTFDPGGTEDGEGIGAEADASADQGGDEDTGEQDQADDAVRGSADTRGILILAGLRYLRSFVYFSVGFGPIGLLALWKGYGAPGSLLWSVPAGLASTFVVRRILRFQTHDTDSSLHPEDLIMRKATVLIPLSQGSMGKVRIEVGMGVSEQYALPEHDDEHFENGETVYVARVSDECVYVESEARFRGSSSSQS